MYIKIIKFDRDKIKKNSIYRNVLASFLKHCAQYEVQFLPDRKFSSGSY